MNNQNTGTTTLDDFYVTTGIQDMSITGITSINPYGSTITLSDSLSWNDPANSSLTVGGNATISGSLTVGGVDIVETFDERLAAIEERLCILRVDEKLAERWEKLGELRKQYLELEQECLEKDKILRLLKGEKA
jgi:hypothetical protein